MSSSRTPKAPPHPDRFLDFFSLEVIVPDMAKVKEMLEAAETLINELEPHSQFQNQKRLNRGRIYYCWHLAKAAHEHVKDLETYPDPPPFNWTHVTVSHFMTLWFLIDKQPDVLATKADDIAETMVPFGTTVRMAAKECYDLVQRWIAA